MHKNDSINLISTSSYVCPVVLSYVYNQLMSTLLSPVPSSYNYEVKMVRVIWVKRVLLGKKHPPLMKSYQTIDLFLSPYIVQFDSPRSLGVGPSPHLLRLSLSPFEYPPIEMNAWEGFHPTMEEFPSLASPPRRTQEMAVDLNSPPQQQQIIDLVSPSPQKQIIDLVSPSPQKQIIDLVSPSPQQPQECPICFEQLDNTNRVRLICGHMSCSVCLRGHCERGNLITNKCYASGCNAEISVATMQQIMSPGSFEPYQQQLTTLSLRRIEGMKLCGNGRCGYGEVHEEWKLETSEGKNCPHCNESCLLCGVRHDSGTSCVDANVSNQMEMNEVLAEIQAEDGRGLCECPCCHEVFAHNGGCVHMTCTKCQFEFCFRCNKRGNTIALADAAWGARRCPCQVGMQGIFLEDDDDWLRGPVNLNL